MAPEIAGKEEATRHWGKGKRGSKIAKSLSTLKRGNHRGVGPKRKESAAGAIRGRRKRPRALPLPWH